MSDGEAREAGADAGATPLVSVRGGGVPTPEEAAAIVAAVEAGWPRPVVDAGPAPTPRWRFSGRWWSKPIPARRDRP